MSFLIYKKTLNIDKQKTDMANIQEIAEQVSLEDKLEIQKHLATISRDARGRLSYRRNDATNLLPYFQKYVDSKVKGNIFGCGGCVVNMLNTMIKIKQEWQNQMT